MALEEQAERLAVAIGGGFDEVRVGVTRIEHAHALIRRRRGAISSLEEPAGPRRLIAMSIAILVSLAVASGQLQTAQQVDIKQGSVANPSGVRQRTYVARRAGAGGSLPTVFFVPWLSCDSVALQPNTRGGIEQLLWRVAADSGWALFLVEK